MDDKFMYNEYSVALAKRIGVDNLEDILKFPKYLTIETTNICNAKCIMCPHNALVGGKMMEDECFEIIVEELKDYVDWIESVALYWFGEPLLDSKLSEKIRILRKIGIKNVQISTNAEKLDKNRADELLKMGLNDIRISMDAIRKDTYEKIRGLSYNTVIENICNLLQLRDEKYKNIPIRIRLVELNENRNEIEEFKAYWKGKVSKIDKVQIMPEMINKSWKKECLKKDYEFPCVSVFSTLVIDVDGNICMCCMDTDKEVCLGNIKNMSLKSAWNDKKLGEIRNKHLSGKKYEIPICENCNCWQRDFKE